MRKSMIVGVLVISSSLVIPVHAGWGWLASGVKEAAKVATKKGVSESAKEAAKGVVKTAGQNVGEAALMTIGGTVLANSAGMVINPAVAAETSPTSDVASSAGNAVSVASNIKDVAGIGVVGYTVAGASAPAIMSTLGTAGAVVGGGVVAGTALVGGAGGLGAASLLNNHVFNGDTKADKAARYATYGGAAAGTAGGIAAIGTAGTVAGLSGAGITSGLAAIGATVGGGMAAGTVMVVAAPIAAAAAVGYGVYWLFSDPEPQANK